MGHDIQYRTYSLNMNKKTIERELNHYVSCATWQEGGGGLAHPIRWIDHVCKDYDEAIDYIKSHDKGWYDQIAVKYKVIPYNINQPTSKKYETLQKRVEAEKAKLTAYSNAHAISTFKAEFVGCPCCGSRLKKQLLAGNTCPLCKTDMRGKTTLDTIARYKSNISSLENQMREECAKLDEAYRKKVEKTATVEWLVKIEYHV